MLRCQGNVSSVDNAGTPGVPDVVLASQYDTAGNRSSLSATVAGTADFLNSYSYNALSELTMLQQTQQTGGNTVAGKELEYAYNAIGLVTSRAAYSFLGTGPRTDVADGAYSYSSKGLLSSLVYTSHSGQQAIDSLGYTYDPLARVSTFTTIDGTATYGYDPTSQLTSATYVAANGGHEPANLSVSFDPNGNRTSTNGTSSTVGADNHISSDGTFNFTFDNAGNLSTRIRISNAAANDYKTVYLWDYRNRLTDVEFFNNSNVLTQHVHYVYDVWDNLIERDLDPNGSGTYTQIVHYVWDQGGGAADNIVLAFNGGQQLIARYVNGPNTSAFDQYYTTLAEEDVTSLSSAGTVTVDLPDPQGSVTDIVDSNGNPADHIVYAPFGAVAYESNPLVLHLAGWQGGILDPVTGDVLFGERWFDLVRGAWDSEDPEGFGAGDTNLTRDVGNSPTNTTDPSGLGWLWGRNNWWERLYGNPPPEDYSAPPPPAKPAGGPTNFGAGVRALSGENSMQGLADRIQSRDETLREFGVELRVGLGCNVEFYDKAKEVPIVGPAAQFLYGDDIREGESRKALLNGAKHLAVGAALGPLHHLATNKNWVSTLTGGPWSPRFAKIFKKAGMTLEDAANTVRIPGHYGPHSERYHQIIFDRLTNATKNLCGKAYTKALNDELRALAKEAMKDGTELNKLLTGG